MHCYACNKATDGHTHDATRCEHCKRVLWEALAQPCSTKPLRDIPYKTLCKWGAANYRTLQGKLFEYDCAQPNNT